MPKQYYQTTKVVTVKDTNKVVVRSNATVTGAKGDPGTSILTGPGSPSSIVGRTGDLWVDINTKIVYGPKTNTGWPTNILFEGFNHDLLGQVFNIGNAASEWQIQHNFGYYPNATCIDTAGTVIEGEISYPDENTIVLRFIGAVSGKAYLS